MSDVTEREILARPFGEASRRDLIDRYFAGRVVVPQDAWKDVYRLLVWVDRSIGLAHCYESDKAQPGKAWYPRTLGFHAWLADELGVPPQDLGGELNWLFRHASERLAEAMARKEEVVAAKARSQRERFGKDLPEPGVDPDLRLILSDLVCAEHQPTEHELRLIEDRLRIYFKEERKRNNLTGEGFEDVLASIIERLPGQPVEVISRKPLSALPGFRRPPGNEKERTVDLAVVAPNGRRTLVTVKWSIRADREEQFGIDYDAYTRMEEAPEDWDYILITNEFDAARLVNACDRRVPGRALFTKVVHVEPRGVLAAYDDGGRGNAALLPLKIATGRLTSLGDWLSSLG